MVSRMRLYSTLGNPNFVAGYLIGPSSWRWPGGDIGEALGKDSLVSRRGRDAGGHHRHRLARGLGRAGGGAVVAGLVVLLGGRLVPSTSATAPELGVAPSSPKKKRRGRVRGFVVPVLLWLVLPVFTRFLDALLGRFEGRLYLWRVSWPFFAEHPCWEAAGEVFSFSSSTYRRGLSPTIPPWPAIGATSGISTTTRCSCGWKREPWAWWPSGGSCGSMAARSRGVCEPRTHPRGASGWRRAPAG